MAPKGFSAEDTYGSQTLCLGPHSPSSTCAFNPELSLLAEFSNPRAVFELACLELRLLGPLNLLFALLSRLRNHAPDLFFPTQAINLSRIAKSILGLLPSRICAISSILLCLHGCVHLYHHGQHVRNTAFVIPLHPSPA